MNEKKQRNKETKKEKKEGTKNNRKIEKKGTNESKKPKKKKKRNKEEKKREKKSEKKTEVSFVSVYNDQRSPMGASWRIRSRLETHRDWPRARWHRFNLMKINALSSFFSLSLVR